MREEQGTFVSFDRLNLFYRFYPSERQSDVLIIVHGHGEHSGRYQKFFKIFEGENIAIAAFDARGNGLSEGAEVHVEFFEEYLEDLSSFVRFLGERYNLKKNVLLLGHSLGGLTAIHWARRFPEKVKALILSSPCLGLKLPAVARIFNRLANEWFPRLRYYNPVYPPHLTHDPAEVENYKKDKLIKRKITARLLHEMHRYMVRLETMEAYTVPFPVYVLMAEIEKVVDAAKTDLFFKKVQAPHKELKIFPGFYHEIFNELGQEKAFEVLKGHLRSLRAASSEGVK